MATPSGSMQGQLPFNGNGPDSHDDADDTNSESGSESDGSVDELPSEDFPLHFSERDGRLFHSSATAPYPLPVDTPEQERLTLNHRILRQCFGSHYVGPVAEVLRDSPRKLVLDICTGNGKWPLEMSEVFPRVHFTAFDIVPIATRYPPNNVQFEIHDVNTPFRYRDGTFDVVNARDIAMAVRDYGQVLGEVARVLRPGGLFVSCEWSPHPPINPTLQQIPSTYIPIITHLHSIANAAFQQTRNLVSPAGRVPDFLVNAGSFRGIVRNQYHIPIGGQHQDDIVQNISEMNLEANRRYGDSVKPLLIEAGWGDEQMNGLLEDYKQELDETDGLCNVLLTVHAFKV